MQLLFVNHNLWVEACQFGDVIDSKSIKARQDVHQGSTPWIHEPSAGIRRAISRRYQTRRQLAIRSHQTGVEIRPEQWVRLEASGV
jgi:hypothetical protein